MKTTWIRKALAVGISMMIPFSVGRTEEPRQVVLKTDSGRSLFFLDENATFYFYLTDPNSAPRAGQLGLTILNMVVHTAPAGIQEIPATEVRFGGVRYMAPAFKIVVIPRPEGHGVFIRIAPDPNGSAEIHLLGVWNHRSPKPPPEPRLYRTKLPPGIEESNSSSTNGSNPAKAADPQERQFIWSSNLRNKSGQTFHLDSSCFKNVPADASWPSVDIPPTTPQA